MWRLLELYEYVLNKNQDEVAQSFKFVKGVFLLLIYNQEQMCIFEENLSYFQSKSSTTKNGQFVLIAQAKLTDIIHLVKRWP